MVYFLFQNQPPAPLQGPAEQPGKIKPTPAQTQEANSRVSPSTPEHATPEKDGDSETDDKHKGKDFKLNPNAKEFVFNPNAKSFTPVRVTKFYKFLM